MFYRFVSSVALLMLLACFEPAGAQTVSPTDTAPALEPERITAADYVRMRRDPAKRVLLIDVRPRRMRRVSSIPGSRWIDSETPTADIVGSLPRLRGATVVFYCTFGPRSMSVALRSMDDLTTAGAKTVGVLDNGIIGWANEERPLVDAQGATRFVHPEQPGMVQALKQPDRAREVPRRRAHGHHRHAHHGHHGRREPHQARLAAQ